MTQSAVDRTIFDAPVAPPSKARRRSSLFVGTAVSVLLLVLALRGVDGSRLVALLRDRNDPALLALAGALMAVSFVPRALRWRLLLAQQGSVSFRPVLWASALGYMGNLLLPARAGEIVRSMLLARVVRMRVSYVLATALAERVADLVAMGVVCGAAVLALTSPPPLLKVGSLALAMLSIVALGAIMAARRVERAAPRIAGRVPRIGPAARSKVADIGAQFARGVASMGARPVIAPFVLFSAAIVACDGLAIVVASAALAMPLGLAGSLVLLAALAVASSIPSAPGYVGTYQLAAVSVLPAFGLDRTESIALVVGLQAINVVVVLALGSFGLVRLHAAVRNRPQIQG